MTAACHSDSTSRGLASRMPRAPSAPNVPRLFNTHRRQPSPTPGQSPRAPAVDDSSHRTVIKRGLSRNAALREILRLPQLVRSHSEAGRSKSAVSRSW